MQVEISTLNLNYKMTTSGHQDKGHQKQEKSEKLSQPRGAKGDVAARYNMKRKRLVGKN